MENFFKQYWLHITGIVLIAVLILTGYRVVAVVVGPVRVELEIPQTVTTTAFQLIAQPTVQSLTPETIAVYETIVATRDSEPFSPEHCSLWTGQQVHVRDNTRVWPHPNVMVADYVKSLPTGTSVYITGGPEWGRIRRDIDYSGWWWRIGETWDGSSIGWIWEGRIAECNYPLD